MDGSNPPPSPPKRRHWVPYSTPESIAAGQISLLALIEIPAATLVFGWLTLHNPWPWTSLLALLAGPILLLRSDPAVEMGVEMLRKWTDDMDSASLHWPSLLGAWATVLGAPKKFRKMQPEEKARFAALARIVRGGRQVVTALFIFGIWSFALEFAQETWPDQMADGVWSWLQPWL
jgi:hypothetical protein